MLFMTKSKAMMKTVLHQNIGIRYLSTGKKEHICYVHIRIDAISFII